MLLYFVFILYYFFLKKNVVILQFLVYWKDDKSLHELFLYNCTFILFERTLNPLHQKKKKVFVLKTKRWSQNMQDIVLAFHLINK